MRLVLAAEEVYAFLLAQGGPEGVFTASVEDGGAHVEVRLALPDDLLPLEAFNLLPRNGENRLPPSRQGLFLAVRTASSLEVLRREGGMVLAFRQDRLYGPTVPASGAVSSEGPWKSRGVEGAEALQLAARVAALGPKGGPSFVFQEGKVVDLLASGRWGAFAAVDPLGSVGAGLFWERRGKTAFLHGPWNFASPSDRAGTVLDFALGELARQDFAGVVLERPGGGPCPERFESLGTLPGAAGEDRDVSFILLGEDDGAPLYVHRVLEPFVRRKLDELCLPRTVHLVDERLCGKSPSAFAVASDSFAGEAVLSVLAPGRDGAANAAAHLGILSEQGVAPIRFALDLGRPDEAAMGGLLVEAGFEPRVLLPWAGKGDRLLLVPSGREAVRRRPSPTSKGSSRPTSATSRPTSPASPTTSCAVFTALPVSSA